MSACESTLRYMKKEAEEAEFWLGKDGGPHEKDGSAAGFREDKDPCLVRARGFIDKMSSLISLCIYKERRVLDIGEEEGDEEGAKEFEVLNLSELREQWDNEDS